MIDFETHPAGTAARLAELEAGRTNPEPVAWKVGVRAFVLESDALNWCEAIQEATNGEQNPVAVPLYAHPPEVGLPEGFEVRENPNEYVFVVQAPGRPGYGVWRDKEPAVYALLEAIKPLWLESAGQKESGDE